MDEVTKGHMLPVTPEHPDTNHWTSYLEFSLTRVADSVKVRGETGSF